MFFDEEEEPPIRTVPKVTIVSAPGKPRKPDGWGMRPLQGEGGSKPDDEDEDDVNQDEEHSDKQGNSKGEHGGDQKPCNVGSAEGEEIEDPKDQLKECCAVSEECAKLHEVLQKCNGRVNSKEKTLETCTEELFDFLHCVDHCVHVERRLFAYLK